MRRECRGNGQPKLARLDVVRRFADAGARRPAAPAGFPPGRGDAGAVLGAAGRPPGDGRRGADHRRPPGQIIAALPGVDPEGVQVFIDEGGALVITGRRDPSPAMRRAMIHRLELPQGQFARRVPLPAGRYGRIDWQAEHGCLTVTLHKTGQAR